MSDEKKFAVLLKPREQQPALDRAVQYARVNSNISIVAVRVINEFDDAEINDITVREQSAFDSIKRSYSVNNLSLKLVFNRDVADGFLKECASGGYDLAIISANKRNTIKDLFVSSIDSSIMRQTTIPLLVVKEAAGVNVVGSSVVVAIDFSDSSETKKYHDYLFMAASKFASSFDGDVHIANCVTPTSSGYSSRNLRESKFVSGGLAEPFEINNQIAEEFAKEHNLTVENVHVLRGRVDEEIPRLCHQLNARMVCMLTTPRSTFLGSVNSSASELVLDQIHGDVFIVNAETIKE